VTEKLSNRNFIKKLTNLFSKKAGTGGDATSNSNNNLRTITETLIETSHDYSLETEERERFNSQVVEGHKKTPSINNKSNTSSLEVK